MGNETYKAINPIISKVGDFTPFYISIAICSVLFGLLIILNVVCCCSRYSDYWLDRHTGNRWIVSIWSATPHKQPPLDFTELERQNQYIQPKDNATYHDFHRQTQGQTSLSRQPLTASQEYLELQKRESDI
ncbi:uncharacterized protein LOC112045726 isoform X2 [Bicyclus anynana]|uniref:Uncharacterized protein LOC112045726 isoform X2 n=1 Tax=Bicyclus anynana TaxID=110368 RepID=A0A6J1MXX8_BICAN|nr:uncharacterized protein LOC112045726 isoform X2 [Bicyclus anynana]